jgi:uncharacterized membrane protein YkvA (DUF1232 family)
MKFPLQSLYDWYRNTLRHPQYRWWIIGGTLIYLISPFDIAPDFLPILGEIDDVALVTLLVAEVSQLVLEKVKLRQTKSSPDPSATATTVDVNAVPVKDP